MSAHELLIAIMAIFAIFGAVDRIAGNRLGLGKQLEEGILAMGTLALAMLWLYFCLCLVFYSAALNQYLENRKYVDNL